jgi:hypothetical protein
LRFEINIVRILGGEPESTPWQKQSCMLQPIRSWMRGPD